MVIFLEDFGQSYSHLFSYSGIYPGYKAHPNVWMLPSNASFRLLFIWLFMCVLHGQCVGLVFKRETTDLVQPPETNSIPIPF